VISVENREKYMLLVFGLIVLGSALDISTDVTHGASLEHVIKESVLLLLSFMAVVWLVWGLRSQQHEIKLLKSSLLEAKKLGADNLKQPQKYVLDARKKLGDVIHQQFDEWELSRSEQDVGWLLLKGLSLKEIASIRETLEKTVRQQASAIYKKAGINGRHEFSAWFIEDIL